MFYKAILSTVALYIALSMNLFAQTARVQVIHNSPDAAASVVDVYLDGNILIDDFAFRTASAFVDAPAGREINIAIAPATSQSVADAIATFPFTLEENATYSVVASGVINPMAYNPFRAFDLKVYAMARETATSSTGNTDVLVFHGSTDAPAVDVVEVKAGAGRIIENMAFGQFKDYLELPTADYALEIQTSDGQNSVVTYSAPLQSLNLNGAAITVVASGFLNPANNSNGAAFGLFAVSPAGGAFIELPLYTPSAATARVQVIHNSPDPLAQTVDIYLNENLLADDFAFRTASAFVDVPAGVEINITVAPSTSESVADGIASYPYTLEEGKTYILVASGVLNPMGYNPLKSFEILVYDMGREEATSETNTDVLVLHGSTDAPAVDVVEVKAGAGRIIENMAYGDFRGYLGLPTADYALEIQTTEGQNSVVTYSAPLQTLELNGAAIIVIASGFLNPSANSNGEPFGLFAITAAGGEFLALPLYEENNTATAKVQVIHNSADALAAEVDVYLNGNLLLDNFEYLSATPFVDVPAGEEITITIAPSTSTSVEDGIASFNYTLEENENYVIIANGLLNQGAYSPFVPFNLAVQSGAKLEAEMDMATEVLVFHGSTDAPNIDVDEILQEVGRVISNLGYGEFFGPGAFVTTDYILTLAAAGTDMPVISYEVPLESLELGGQSITVFAGGFLNPAENSNGQDFGLYAVTVDGNVLPLDVFIDFRNTAFLQVIHNSPDALASAVDIYVNGELAIPGFQFLEATEYLPVPANEDIEVAIAPANSNSVNEAVATFNYELEAMRFYIAIASGVLNEAGYSPFQEFDLAVYDMARPVANEETNTDVLVFHGSTDAPTVDVQETLVGAGTIVDDISFGEFQGYLELPTANYQLSVTDQTGENTVVSYDAPLADLELQGESLTIIAAGFLNPQANSNGRAFGLFVVSSEGDVLELPLSMSVESAKKVVSIKTFPNPTTSSSTISFSSDAIGTANIEVYDMFGNVALRVDNVSISDGNNEINLDLTNLSSGSYIVRTIGLDKSYIGTLRVIK